VENLVLIRVAAYLDESLSGAALTEMREEPSHRVRLTFARGESSRSILLSLAPGRPWLGRPGTRRSRRPRPPGGFVSACGRVLRGLVLRGVAKPAADRLVTFEFAGGHRLTAELNPQAPNLVLVDPAGTIVGAARKPRSARARLAPGRPYEVPTLPVDRLDPFRLDAAAIDGAIERLAAGGLARREALGRGFVGIGKVAIELILVESGREPVGRVVEKRLAAVSRGEVDPVIEAPEDPRESAGRGVLDPALCRLLPWPPARAPERPLHLVARSDPSTTAGLYHEAIDRVEQDRRRARDLRGVLDREIRRVARAEAAARNDRDGFEDPDRYRLQGEALLAGLTRARRVGSRVLVPDPYDSAGGDLVIELTPGRSLSGAAEGLFVRHRRARRGLERTEERIEQLAARRTRLVRIQDRFATDLDLGSTKELESAMQDERIPVGLERPTRADRSAAQMSRPRLEGVRIFTSRDGQSILVGKTGRDNDRLTFKLAGPEDFWLHAGDTAGAHVVLRNDERRSRPSRVALEDAAAAAAWFSGARAQGKVDVRWTRRKYVRRARGAPRGTVILKKFETIRVFARRPDTPLERR